MKDRGAGSRVQIGRESNYIFKSSALSGCLNCHVVERVDEGLWNSHSSQYQAIDLKENLLYFTFLTGHCLP